MPTWLPLAAFVPVAGLMVLHVASAGTRTWVWKVLLALGVAMLGFGVWLGLWWAPAERNMGDVYRIIYVHVPHVWVALMACVLNFGCSVAFLMKKSWVSDTLAETTAEVGLYFGTVGVALGAIWARPTWGVWWDWDPRLTTTAILLVVYSGYLALRKFVEDPEKRATWSAVVGILAGVDIPILWFSVRWWRSLHQTQSNTASMAPEMRTVMWWMVVAFVCFWFAFVYQRYLIAQAVRKREVALPEALPPVQGATS